MRTSTGRSATMSFRVTGDLFPRRFTARPGNRGALLRYALYSFLALPAEDRARLVDDTYMPVRSDRPRKACTANLFPTTKFELRQEAGRLGVSVSEIVEVALVHWKGLPTEKREQSANVHHAYEVENQRAKKQRTDGLFTKKPARVQQPGAEI